RMPWPPIPQKSPACTLDHHDNPLPAAPDTLAQLPTPVPAEALALLGVAEVLAQLSEPTRAVLHGLGAAHTDVLAHPASGAPLVLSRLDAAAMHQLTRPKASQLKAPAAASDTHKGRTRASAVPPLARPPQPQYLPPNPALRGIRSAAGVNPPPPLNRLPGQAST
ncbi:UNVERIFIED_CONTAM: hypothetical protein K2H54_052495, partial [Gekko kuhli]